MRQEPFPAGSYSAPRRGSAHRAAAACLLCLAAVAAPAAGPPASERAGQSLRAPGEDDLVLPAPPDRDAEPRSVGGSSRTQDWVVRVIYFRPTDRAAWPRLAEELDRAMRLFQNWLEREMTRHGFPGRKLRFETGPGGRLLVHEFQGAYDAAFYQNAPAPSDAVLAELDADPAFSDLSRETQIVIAHVHLEHPDDTLEYVIWPTAAIPSLQFNKAGGRARFDTSWVIPIEPYLFDDPTPASRPSSFTSEDCQLLVQEGITVGSLASQNFGAWLHEMLHALGLIHERHEGQFSAISGGAFRFARSVSPHGPAPGVKLPECHAKRLSLSPFFDPQPPNDDTTGPSVTILEPSPGQFFRHGDPVLVRAQVQDAGSGVGYVEFVGGDGNWTEHCVMPAGAQDLIVEYEFRGHFFGNQRVYVRAIDAEGNTGPASEDSREFTVQSYPMGPDLVPYGICHDPPHPLPGTTVQVFAGIDNIGNTVASATPLVSWHRDVAAPPGYAPGDLEAELSSPVFVNVQVVELGTYVYGGGQEKAAIRVDRLGEATAEVDKQNNVFWPLLFGSWPDCHGGDPVTGLAVTKSPAGDQLVVHWNATADMCHVAYRVFEADTAVPFDGPGQFPVDPDFRDISLNDLDGSRTDTSLTIPMPPDDRYYLVVNEGQTGHSGQVDHYGE